MKTNFCVIILSALNIMNAFSGPSDNNALFNQINNHWNEREYAAILGQIQDREQNNPNDILALSLKLYYYVFAIKDIPQAHQIATQLTAHVNSSSNQRFKDLGQMMVKRVTDIPATENTPWTQEQKDALHDAMDEYPFIQDCFVLWGLATGQIE